MNENAARLDRHRDGSVRSLVETARAGDLGAMGHALEACRRYLTLIAREDMEADLRAKEGASDLVQETFLIARRRFGQFRGRNEEELRAWLRRILKHRLAKFRDRYQGTAMRRASREANLGDQNALMDGIRGDLTSPSEAFRREEERAALDVALARLPDRYRLAIILRHEQGLRFEQIAAELGTTTEGARKTWARAVERLRDQLGVDFS